MPIYCFRQSAIYAVEYCKNYALIKGRRVRMLPYTCGITALSFRSTFCSRCCTRRQQRNDYSQDDSESSESEEEPGRMRCCVFCGCNQPTVDAAELYTGLSSELLLQIAEQRKIAFQKPIGVAFITFGSPIYALKQVFCLVFLLRHLFIRCTFANHILRDLNPSCSSYSYL